MLILVFKHIICWTKNKLLGFSPQANYTDPGFFLSLFVYAEGGDNMFLRNFGWLLMDNTALSIQEISLFLVKEW
jgi:hypothetical protein